MTDAHFEQEEQQLYDDIRAARQALDLFLDSRIVESEAILKPELCEKSMYYALAKAVLLALKSVMTFQSADFEVAINAMQHTVQLARNIQRQSHSSLWFLTSWIHTGLTPEKLKQMRPLHRHAARLHIRQAYMTYTVLEKYVLQVDEENTGGTPPDDHFRSGVLFGMGAFKVMLSLLPRTVLRLIEFIGFTSDREQGMKLLQAPGEWDVYKKTGEMPSIQGPDEGLRRQFCDMLLIAYHVLLAKLIPVNDCDDPLAAAILSYNLQLYPNGVFFLYLHGRQLFSETKLDEATDEYIRAINIQKDWKQLQHICYWERGLVSTLQQDWKTAAEMFDILYMESNWSKAVYTYFKGVALYMHALEEKQDAKKRHSLMTQATYMMKKVPGARQKIAGRSIPLEKFVARKARKFIEQNNFLLFPDLEVTNAFGACEYLPLPLLRSNIKRIDIELSALDEIVDPYYADNICLGHFLRAKLARLTYTRSEDPTERDTMRALQRESVDKVFSQAKHVRLDHYVYYFTRYENARMMMIDGRNKEAEAELDIILRAADKGSYGIGAGPKAKNKYSLEHTLVFKTHNCKAELQRMT
ncbi:40s ribosomal protein s7 [Lichtheimia corymbifera JMRC:FSU:9682]|uniref:40s ribosomal protein s7 n=1 Tax=Lichtheimia corymbifera JMRC:FSU:9682 TaxID=1263082 RepID=A0A068RZS6_9FUNG|nr:40s ribosomal protein s7 [Lichtheimia corymbifera JMRC:FSU:9682]